MMKTKRRNLTWSDIDMAKVELSNLVIHFAQSNKVEGKSPKTVSWYSEMLTDFVRFLESNAITPILQEFSVNNVRQFIIHEQERKLSPFTIQGKMRALKAFSSWLFREGYISDNLLAIIKLPKAPDKIIEPLTTEEIDKLINAQNPLTAIGSRNIAILTMLLDTGERENELCCQEIEDTHIEEGYLKVMGKGSKERILTFGSLAQKVLWRYVIHFRPEPENGSEKYLFLTLDGKKLEPNAIKLLLKRWGKRAGVPRLHCHLCRHTFATSFLVNKCGDVFRLQQMLGHTTLEMVRRYVHFASTQDMIRGHVLSPMDRMGLKGLRSYKIDRILKTNNEKQSNIKGGQA
jgi:integrase/recombinase XerC/integrase/recombinase XerD